MKLQTINDLYLDELKDLFSAENQLLKALPKMAKAASHPESSQAIMDHLAETQGQVERLEQIFKSLGAARKEKM